MSLRHGLFISLTSLALHSLSAVAISAIVPAATLQSCAAGLNGQVPVPTPPGFDFSGKVRTYYIAAEEVEWDYAPTGWDNWLGVPMNVSPRADMAGAKQYGTKWLKALYRGYTDSSFTTYTYTKHSEGGDYPNNTAPGVNVVLPETEAVPPVDGGLGPGGCVVYKWMVDAIAGPNAGEPAGVHSYHSYVALQQDTDAGLIGPQIVYASGEMNNTMTSYREIPLLYMIYDEADSWLSAENRAALGGSGSSNGGYEGGSSSYGKRDAQGGPGDNHGPYSYGGPNQHGAPTQASSSSVSSSTSSGQSSQSNQASSYGAPSTGGYASGLSSTTSLWSGNYTVWHPQIVNLAGAGQFMGAPSFHTMNGYIFGNNPTFEMCLSDKVIWYVNAYGSANHVFHMHGNSFRYHGYGEYAISINDGVGKTLYMDATGQGKWQVLCHVNNH